MAPKYEPLLENVQDAECGDMLTYEQAMELGFDLRSFAGRAMVSTVNRILERQGRTLEAVRNVGYQVLCHDDAVSAGVRKGRRGARFMRRAATLISAATSTGLSRYDRQQAEDHANHLRRLADQASRRAPKQL
jgi:hypothetical protein